VPALFRPLIFIADHHFAANPPAIPLLEQRQVVPLDFEYNNSKKLTTLDAGPTFGGRIQCFCYSSRTAAHLPAYSTWLSLGIHNGRRCVWHITSPSN